MPLAESRGGASGGVWGNAPTVPRATISPNAPNKGAGSEASLPVTLRIRRCAPSLLHPPLAHCRAKWARPSISHFLFYNATFEMQGFRHCGGDAEFVSRPLDPFGAHSHVSCFFLLLALSCGRRIRPVGRGGASVQSLLPSKSCRRTLSGASLLTFCR